MNKNDPFSQGPNQEPERSDEPTRAVPSLSQQSLTDPTIDPSLASFLQPDAETSEIVMEDEPIRYTEVEEPDGEPMEQSSVQGRMYKKKSFDKKPKAERRAPKLPYFEGLLNQMKTRYAANASARTFLYVVIYVLLCLALIAALALMAVIYLGALLALCLAALFLILISIALIVAGIAGLCYGIVLIFTSALSIALIEIGLATMFFGIICALVSLSYELVSGRLPRIIRYLTRLFLYVIICFLTYVFGSDKFLPSKDDRREAKVH